MKNKRFLVLACISLIMTGCGDKNASLYEVEETPVVEEQQLPHGYGNIEAQVDPNADKDKDLGTKHIVIIDGIPYAELDGDTTLTNKAELLKNNTSEQKEDDSEQQDSIIDDIKEAADSTAEVSEAKTTEDKDDTKTEVETDTKTEGKTSSLDELTASVDNKKEEKSDEKEEKSDEKEDEASKDSSTDNSENNTSVKKEESEEVTTEEKESETKENKILDSFIDIALMNELDEQHFTHDDLDYLVNKYGLKIDPNDSYKEVSIAADSENQAMYVLFTYDNSSDLSKALEYDKKSFDEILNTEVLEDTSTMFKVKITDAAKKKSSINELMTVNDGDNHYLLEAIYLSDNTIAAKTFDNIKADINN